MSQKKGFSTRIGLLYCAFVPFLLLHHGFHGHPEFIVLSSSRNITVFVLLFISEAIAQLRKFAHFDGFLLSPFQVHLPLWPVATNSFRWTAHRDNK